MEHNKRVSPPDTDAELELVNRLVRVAAQAGVAADPVTMINVYVAVKTKPLAILAGPPRSGKAAMVESLGRVLLEEPWRLQMMLGHAWWAEGSRNVATFTEAQTRCNTTKIYALLQEAAQPENTLRAYVGCLTQISPAELVGFFSEVAFQLQHERLMCLPSFHLREAIPIPDNLLLFGTMDTAVLDWPDDDLYSCSTVIQWPAPDVRKPLDRCSPGAAIPGAERTFLRSRIQSEPAATAKLHAITGGRSQLMRAFWQLENAFREQDVPVAEPLAKDALLYVANAWTEQGHGLFDHDIECNMTIALDLAIAQMILTPKSEEIRTCASLPAALRAILDGRFPRSSGFLRMLTQTNSEEEVDRSWNAIPCAG